MGLPKARDDIEGRVGLDLSCHPPPLVPGLKTDRQTDKSESWWELCLWQGWWAHTIWGVKLTRFPLPSPE